MKRILTQAFLLLISLQVLSLHAQEKQDFAPTRIIKGAVIDKNGNPIPGATVRSTQGAETAITDADGTYTIEVPFWLKSLTASYPGLRDQKLNTTDKTITIFTLKPLYRTYGFVNVMFANVWQIKPFQSYSSVQQLGLMGGAYREWGGYAKVMMGFTGGSGHDMSGKSDIYPVPTVTGGAIKRINSNLNMYFGAGVAWNYGFNKGAYDGSAPWIERKDVTREEMTGAVEYGIMGKWRKLNGTIGITYIAPSNNKWNAGNIALHIGVGMNI